MERKQARLSIQHSPYGIPKSLNLGRKVFLSHSGRDKDFVCFLHERLCRWYHDSIVFFDIETLPTAEPVSMDNILEEARRSKLGVLVLTEHFFTHTPNPMRELEAFVDSEVQLLPLFFKMSVNEFKEKERRDGWEKRWREWSDVDDQVIKKWKEALDVVSTFSGLEYCKIATNHSAYVDKVVKEVTRIVPPVIPFSKEGVCGKERLCKIVDDMYERCASKRSSSIDGMSTQGASTSAISSLREDGIYTVDLVGIHGFAGLGKTTLCESLCDHYFLEFNGRVCHVDLGSPPSCPPSCQVSFREHSFSSRVQRVLSMLTGYINELQYNQGIHEVQNRLKSRLSSMMDPVFLAIDNIRPETESQEEADFYLSCKFPRGSKILITSLTEKILTNLTSQHSGRFSIVIMYMSELKFEEARDIFMHEFPDLCGKKFSNLGDELNDLQNHLNECVDMCTIHYKRYHPVMLKSLAAYIRWKGRRNQDWKERLRELRSERVLNVDDAWEGVFKMMDNNYALLTEEAKNVFLDSAIFFSATHTYPHEWIQRLYSHLKKEKMDKIILELQDLCFIEGPDQFDQWTFLDLQVNFSKYKIGKDINYVVEDDSQYWPDDLPRTTRHVSISRCRMASSMLDMRDVNGPLRVLHLVDNAGLQQVLLSRTTCADLRSLIVRVPIFTSLCFTLDEDWSTRAASPSQVRGDRGRPCMHNVVWVELEGNICFEPASLRHLPSDVVSHSLRKLGPVQMHLGSIFGRNLKVLKLSRLPSVQSIDITTCANLKELCIDDMPKLRSVEGVDNSHLEHVTIRSCEELLALAFSVDNCKLCSTMGSCTHYARNLDFLQLSNLPSLSCISGLDKSTKLERLFVSGCDRLQVLAIPSNHCTLAIEHCRSLERIALCRMSSYPTGAYCRNQCRLCICECPSFRALDGLVGSVLDYAQFSDSNGSLILESFGELVEGAQIDSSICKAKVLCAFQNIRLHTQWLAGVKRMYLEDAQHIGLLISALFNTCLKNLQNVTIYCKGGDCGCDQNPASFDEEQHEDEDQEDYKEEDEDEVEEEYFTYDSPSFQYCCPQVRDLASLAQWHLLRSLNLSGCTSVEVWPDFTVMTSLEILDLSETSLKEWPPGVHLIPPLRLFYLEGCRQLSAEELMKVVTFEFQNCTLAHSSCIRGSLTSLRNDLDAGRRDRCSVVHTLRKFFPEFVALFYQFPSFRNYQIFAIARIYNLLKEVMSRLPFEDEEGGYHSSTLNSFVMLEAL